MPSRGRNRLLCDGFQCVRQFVSGILCRRLGPHNPPALDGEPLSLAGAERRSALQRAILALGMPTHKRRFAPGDLQFLTSSTYRRAKLFESDRWPGADPSGLRSLCELRLQRADLKCKVCASRRSLNARGWGSRRPHKVCLSAFLRDRQHAYSPRCTRLRPRCRRAS